MLRLTLLAAAVLASLALAATALATVVQEGTLRVSIATQIKPYRLPRTDPAPIKVLIAGHVFTSTGATPPQLTRMTVLINKHGRLEPKSIPSCQADQIRPATTAQAIERCGRALVGSGHFWASVVLPEQGVYHTTGRLLAFNGTATVCSPASDSSLARRPRMRSGGDAALMRDPRSAGRDHGLDPLAGNRIADAAAAAVGLNAPARAPKVRRFRGPARDPNPSDRGQRDAKCHTRPEFLAQIYTTQPFPSSFVVPFSIRDIDQGPYGTELSGSLPAALGEWGFVNRIKMTLGKEIQVGGRTHSYLDASCPAPKGTKGASFPLARANFYFLGGERLDATVTKSCGVKE